MASFIKSSLVVLGLVGLSQTSTVSYGSSAAIRPSYSNGDAVAYHSVGDYSVPAYAAPLYSIPIYPDQSYSASSYSTPAYSIPASWAPSYSVPSSVSSSASSRYVSSPATASYNAATTDGAYGTALTPVSDAYGNIVKVSAQPLYAHELNSGPTNYKVYVSPIQYSKVLLPIVPSDAVAKVYAPQNSGYASGSSY